MLNNNKTNAPGSFRDGTSNCVYTYNTFTSRLSDKIETIEKEIKSWNASKRENLIVTVDEVSKEMVKMQTNKNKVVLEGSKLHLDTLFQNKNKIWELFLHAGILQSDIKTMIKLEHYIIIELKSHELKQKALTNAQKIKNVLCGIYLNDCLTERQRLNSKILREELKSLNKQLPNIGKFGNYGVDNETGEAYYYGVRSGQIKKVVINLHA
jgi:hypothetical protein